jgi:hypothetical protein
MASSPIRLTDQQLADVTQAARNFRPRDRSALLRLIATELHLCAEISDAAVHRALRQAMAQMRNARERWLS